MSTTSPGLVLPRRITGLRNRLTAILLALSPSLLGSAADVSPAAEPAVMRYSFAKSLFAGVNENDASAAVKVYSRFIADENGIASSDGPSLLDGTNAIVKALKWGQIDVVCLPVEDFVAIEGEGLEGPLILSTVNHSFTTEYVLLVREDRGLRTVEELRGHTLMILNDTRVSLARIWVEVLCREHGMGPIGLDSLSITPTAKASLAVLPVFFGKVDGCVVPQDAWEVMGEMNPQVLKQLREVAHSQPMVSVVTGFRHGFSENLKARAIKAAEGSAGKSAFTQLMALFKSDGVVVQPVSCLESTRELLAKYHQLGTTTNTGAVPALNSGGGPRLTERRGE